MTVAVRNLVLRRRDREIRCPDFELPPGQSLAIAGPSGSGKTSILLALAGILKPQDGTIHVGGALLWSLSEERRAIFRGRNIGYVFASFHLVDALNVNENLQLARTCAGLPPDTERARTLLAHLGVQTLAGQRTDRLSQGQMQRVAIARAMMNHPKLLLCDEPTAALDAVSAGRLVDLLKRSAGEEKAALVMATHDPHVMAAADATLHITAAEFDA
ncbi:MAG: ATP-binding cassette domain-containing protein [Asticcacaulis sp.]